MDGKEVIEKRIEELKGLFKSTQDEIAITADEYNEKIKAIRASKDEEVNKLLQEAETKISKLAEQREQFRGAYTELYYILHPEQREKDAKIVEQQEKTTNEPVVTSGYMEVQQEVPQATVELGSVTTTMSEEDTNKTDSDTTSEQSNLTEEEIQAIEQITEQTETPKTNEVTSTSKVNENDIPEYLQEEYNKK